MADKLRVGIIGMGTIGPIHAEAYQSTGQAEIVGICDIDKIRLASQGDRFNVRHRVEDYRELLKLDLDSVDVCVPNYLHREVAVAALHAGKNVLLEKPMAMNAAEAADIVAAEKASGKVLQVAMCQRQRPVVQVVRDYVQAGHLGNVYHMHATLIRRRGIPGMGGWFTTKSQSGGGPMIDLGVHWFDLSMYASGLWNPTSVSSRVYAKFGPAMHDYKYVKMWAGPPKFEGKFDVEDYSTGFVRFGDKATLSFHIAWAANQHEDSHIDLMGDKGGVRFAGNEPLKFLTEHQGRIADINPHFDDKPNHFHVQAGKFIAACRGEMPPACTGQQGLTVMKLIDAIYASSQANKEVSIG